MGFRPFGVCTRFNSLNYAERAYNSEKCPFEKPKTNYDRIRNMSVEEMAEFLLDISYDNEYMDWVTSNGELFADYHYKKALAEEIKWLECEATE